MSKKDQKELTEEQIKKIQEMDPREFIYEDGIKVKIDGKLITLSIDLSSRIFEKMVDTFYPIIPMYIKDGKKVEEGTEGAEKVIDYEATAANPEGYQGVSQLGYMALRAHLFYMIEHANAVKSGKAVRKKELKEKQQMKPVK